MKTASLLLAVMLVTQAQAAVIDVTVAPTVEVTEPDWLTVLETRAQEAETLGLFRQKFGEARERFTRLADIPVDLRLPEASVTTTRTFLMPERPVDAPALPASFTRTYVFFDAGSARERAYAKAVIKDVPAARLVAVAGSLTTASAPRTRETLAGIRLYADQGGTLTRRFALTATPARVTVTTTTITVTQTALTDNNQETTP